MELGREDKEIMDAGEEAGGGGGGGGRVRGERQRTSFTENVTMQSCSESRLPPTPLFFFRRFFVVFSFFFFFSFLFFSFPSLSLALKVA